MKFACSGSFPSGAKDIGDQKDLNSIYLTSTGNQGENARYEVAIED